MLCHGGVFFCWNQSTTILITAWGGRRKECLWFTCWCCTLACWLGKKVHFFSLSLVSKEEDKYRGDNNTYALLDSTTFILSFLLTHSLGLQHVCSRIHHRARQTHSPATSSGECAFEFRGLFSALSAREARRRGRGSKLTLLPPPAATSIYRSIES